MMLILPSCFAWFVLIVLTGKGDEQPGRDPADVVFIIDEKPHSWFKREGNNLIYKHQLPLVDALCGFVVAIKTLDGRMIQIPVDSPVAPGETRVVRGEGMPISKQPHSRGDLKIYFDVQFPRQLSEQQKAALKAALPR